MSQSEPEAATRILFLKLELAKRTIPLILIVEDDDNDIVILTKELSRFICRFLVARSADDAIFLLTNHHIDLVLLDLRLPIVPGVEVLRRQKKLNPDTHFVVVTGVKNPQEMNEALQAGAILTLEKPLTHNQLSKILRPKEDGPSTN